jgi:hypothetical protein
MKMKEAVLASPERTAFQRIDGKRAYLGYGNGSVFLSKRPDFLIVKKVSPSEPHPDRWEPLKDGVQ